MYKIISLTRPDSEATAIHIDHVSDDKYVVLTIPRIRARLTPDEARQLAEALLDAANEAAKA